jgi:conjugative relaxase-like TrwC/TraI family protein
VLILKPIADRVARYYLAQGPGQWIGRGSAGLGLEGIPRATELTAVLRGCHPSTGAYLPRLRSARRRAGWDLVFAAPKSLSLVSAGDQDRGGAISVAHRCAVEGAVEHLQQESGKDMVAAAFAHATNAGGEPHVHTHVLVANLAPVAGGWAALGTWLPRDELAALYHLGLRHHLDRAGLNLEWRIRPDGLPDLAGVPRAAVRATSTRGHESRLGAGWAGRQGPPRDWVGAASNAGWDQDRAAGVASSPATALPVEASSLETRVSSRLLTRGSTFTKRDVLVALAAASPAGLAADLASSWADSFCRQAIHVGGGSNRFTTPRAQEVDRRLADMIGRRVEGGLATGVGGEHAAPAVQAFATDPTLSAESVATAHRLGCSEAVVVLAAGEGCSNFVSHAAVLGVCTSAWEAQGKRVAVATRRPADAARWHALCGLEDFHPSGRPDVILVDQADRRPPGELMALLSASPQAKVVFIEGGTLPRARTDASLGYTRVASEVPRLDPGPAPDWRLLDHDTTASLSAGLAAGHLMSRWAEGLEAGRREESIMVGLGQPEALALNGAARRHLRATGRLNGPSIEAWGREFQAGDRVVAIRGAGAGLPCGTVGTVVDVDPKKRSVMITWPDRATPMKREQLATIGHAYAATPRLANRMNGPVLVLGRADGLGLERSRVAAEISVQRHGAEHQPSLVREL